jgi:hypothetical protein
MKKVSVLLYFLLLVVVVFSFPTSSIFAEKVGNSPESGATSRISTLNSALVTLGFGSISAGSWGDWGSWWNRIYSSSINNVNYSLQSLVEWDDYKTGVYTGEDSTWNNTAGTATGGVWQDTRTGLYWSVNQGSMTDVFPDTTHTTCPFFTNRITYDGLTSACGNAINACGALSLEGLTGQGAKTDWYLPSQKELMQAYIDGIYVKSNTTWATASYFWSSTEASSTASYAWYVYLGGGSTGYNGKSNSYAVRCVRRD